MKITVCIGSSCHLKGSRSVVETFQDLIAKNRLEDIVLGGTFCMGNCQSAVSVDVDGTVYSVNPEGAEDFFNRVILARGKSL